MLLIIELDFEVMGDQLNCALRRGRGLIVHDNYPLPSPHHNLHFPFA
jgi:hypothetical protein